MIEYNTTPPCYGCEDRSIDCHSDCQKYLEWTKQIKELRKKRLEEERLTRWRIEK